MDKLSNQLLFIIFGSVNLFWRSYTRLIDDVENDENYYLNESYLNR